MKRILISALVMSVMSSSVMASPVLRQANKEETGKIVEVIMSSAFQECPQYPMGKVIFAARGAKVLPVMEGTKKEVILQFEGFSQSGEPALVRTLIDVANGKILSTVSMDHGKMVNLDDTNSLIIPALCQAASK